MATARGFVLTVAKRSAGRRNTRQLSRVRCAGRPASTWALKLPCHRNAIQKLGKSFAIAFRPRSRLQENECRLPRRGDQAKSIEPAAQLFKDWSPRSRASNPRFEKPGERRGGLFLRVTVRHAARIADQLGEGSNLAALFGSARTGRVGTCKANRSRWQAMPAMFACSRAVRARNACGVRRSEDEKRPPSMGSRRLMR